MVNVYIITSLSLQVCIFDCMLYVYVLYILPGGCVGRIMYAKYDIVSDVAFACIEYNKFGWDLGVAHEKNSRKR